jgi:hypothetical protein
MGKLFLQNNELRRKGNDPLDIEGDHDDIARVLAKCTVDSPFFLPEVFPSLSRSAQLSLEFAMTMNNTLMPWWTQMQSDYSALRGQMTWNPKDLDVVWSADFETPLITEVLRVASGKVFVVMRQVGADRIIKSEVEFNLCSAELLDDHLRDSALRVTAKAESIIAVIRSPMVDREISLSDGNSVGTIHRRGPSGEDCGGWHLNEPKDHIIIGETDI